jgi:lipoprotein signal peptidase
VNVIDLIGVWVGVFLTLMVLSFLYKENSFFRLTEYIFTGLASGYAFAASLRLFINQTLNPIFVAGNLTFIVPLILGALFYAQFTKKYSDLYRLPLSLSIGYGLGVTIWSVFAEFFVKQVTATMLPIINSNALVTLDNAVLVAGTILSLSYFILHREQKGVWGRFTKVGKYFILATLGAVFGSTVLGRMAVIIQRVQFLLGDPSFPWRALGMGTPQEGAYAPIAIVVFLVTFGFYMYRDRNKSRLAAAQSKPTKS